MSIIFFLLDAPLIRYLALIDFFEIILSPFCKQIQTARETMTELLSMTRDVIHRQRRHREP